MQSYPSRSEVIDVLGSKIVSALNDAVRRAEVDFEEYRRLHPGWAARHTERTLANLIHDHFWHHLLLLLDEVDGVMFVDEEPTREMWVGANYRVRLKRHNDYDKVSSYPTQAALEFFRQPGAQPTLEGLERVHLCAGYQWDRETRSMGAAVLSLRDGQDNVIWLEELAPPAEGGAVGTSMPPLPIPPSPSIDAGTDAAASEDGSA